MKSYQEKSGKVIDKPDKLVRKQQRQAKEASKA